MTHSGSALAKAKSDEANETVRTRLKEAWCYLLYPRQDSAAADVAWISGKVPASDALIGQASKRLVNEEGLLPDLGPARLDRELQKYIWKGKNHLPLRDIQEYLNRYTYLPRLKDRSVLARTVAGAICNLLPGPFAYAESWDEAARTYSGLAINSSANVNVVIDNESVIVRPSIAEDHRQLPKPEPSPISEPVPKTGPVPIPVPNPTRFTGTVMIASERPARDIHRIVEGIVEQLTTLPGSEVSLRLEIDAEVSSGLDSSKVRTLKENANTLGFIEKSIM